MWNYPAWRANTAKALKEKPMANGPWSPQTWYPVRPTNLPSWPWWRQFNSMTVSKREEVIFMTTLINDDGDKTDEYRRTTRYFDAFADGEDIWRGGPGHTLPPAGANGWIHNSATAWGDGLYECAGNIWCWGIGTGTDYYAVTFTPGDPSEPGGGTIIYDDTVHPPHEASFQFGYSSDIGAIDGLDTPCPMSIPYSVVAPGGYRGELFAPPPSGEWMFERALRFLANGNVFAEDPVPQGFLSGVYETNGSWTAEFSCLHDLSIIFT